MPRDSCVHALISTHPQPRPNRRTIDSCADSIAESPHDAPNDTATSTHTNGHTQTPATRSADVKRHGLRLHAGSVTPQTTAAMKRTPMKCQHAPYDAQPDASHASEHCSPQSTHASSSELSEVQAVSTSTACAPQCPSIEQTKTRTQTSRHTPQPASLASSDQSHVCSHTACVSM